MTRAILTLVLLVPVSAQAGDSLHATCTGSVSIDAGDGKPETKKIVATFDDARAGADSRRTTIRATVDGKTYTGTAVSSEDAVPIKLEAGSAVLFVGMVSYQSDMLSIAGEYLLSKRKPKLSGTLTCKER